MDSPSRVVMEANAKINLFLEITGRREDGYHLLDTVMQSVSLSDVLIIGKRDQPGIRITCSRPGIPEDETNLTYRAAEAFFDAAGLPPTRGLHIHIDKSIPEQAGLGGGSADAAAVLEGLNLLFDAGLTGQQLTDIGLSLGADLPFALLGGCARARGIGQNLTPLPRGLPDCFIVLAKPSSGACTGQSYALYDSCGGFPARDIDGMLSALVKSDLEGVGREMYNVFEMVSSDSSTNRIKEIMTLHHALGAALTGSGSAVAGLFSSRTSALSCLPALRVAARECFLVRPARRGLRLLFA